MAPSLDDDLSNAEDSDSRHYVGGRSGLTNGSSGGLTGTVGASTGSNAAAATAAGGRSRYLALKERRARLGRSRSSHNLGNDDDDLDDDPPLSPTTASPSAYLASRCAKIRESRPVFLRDHFHFFLIFERIPLWRQN